MGSILRLVSITAQKAIQDKAQVNGRLAKGVARFRRAAAVAAGPDTTRIESSLRSRDNPKMEPPKPASVTLTMDSMTCSSDNGDVDVGGSEEFAGGSVSVMVICRWEKMKKERGWLPPFRIGCLLKSKKSQFPVINPFSDIFAI